MATYERSIRLELYINDYGDEGDEYDDDDNN